MILTNSFLFAILAIWYFNWLNKVIKFLLTLFIQLLFVTYFSLSVMLQYRVQGLIGGCPGTAFEVVCLPSYMVLWLEKSKTSNTELTMSYNVIKLTLISPIDCWQNFNPFWCKTHLIWANCTMSELLQELARVLTL